MNRIWAVVLIIVAALALGAGTYWYFELREEVVQVQQEISVPVREEQQTTPVSSFEEEEEEDTKKEIEQILREPEVPMPPDTPDPVETLREEVAEVALASEPVEITRPRIPSMPQPHPTLSLVAAGLLKLPSHVPSVQLPYAPPSVIEVQKEEPITIEEIQEPEPSVMQAVVEQPLEKTPEETFAIVEDFVIEKEEIAEEEKPVTLVPQIPSEPIIPTSRVEVDPRPLSW
ncbi:MAG: hypothetical protein EOM15_10950, partial [Spirochaetia bacterium]|nr:hypothetical protein [Spirochaetia bacterium]